MARPGLSTGRQPGSYWQPDGTPQYQGSGSQWNQPVARGAGESAGPQDHRSAVGNPAILPASTAATALATKRSWFARHKILTGLLGVSPCSSSSSAGWGVVGRLAQHWRPLFLPAQRRHPRPRLPPTRLPPTRLPPTRLPPTRLPRQGYRRQGCRQGCRGPGPQYGGC